MTLRPGTRSSAVRILQNRLRAQGFWVAPMDGSYGVATQQAVMAFQKATGLGRDGVAGPVTLARLRSGVAVAARSTKGHVIEIDKARQLLKIVDDGKVRIILNTSTGTGLPYRTDTGATEIAVTPVGRFRIGWQVTGWRKSPLGYLYSPKFYYRGWAIHGSTSIPGYPASHGCARVSVPAMTYLWSSRQAQLGTPVWVY